MPKLKRNCWTLPYHRKRRAIKQLQHVKSLRKKVLASTKPEEFTVEVADSGVVIGTGTIHDSYWSVTIPEDGNHFNGDSNSCTSQDIFENEHTDLDLEIVFDENSAEKHCIQIIGEEDNRFEKIDIEHLDENLAKEHGIIIDREEENSFKTNQYVGIGNEMVSSESNELSGVISPLASYNDNNYNAVQTDCLSKTVQYVEIGSEMVSSLIDNSYNTDQTGGLRITENKENSSETVQCIEISSERELSKNNELYRVVTPITSLIDNSHNTVQTDGVRITRNEQNSFETGQYAEHVEIGSDMASSENNELNSVDSPFPSYNSYSAVLYNNNSYTTVQTDFSQQDCNDVSESNALGGVIAPVTLYNNSSYRTVQTEASQQDYHDGSESNELGGLIAPVTLYNNSSYNTVQTDASQQDNHDGSDTDSTVSNDFVTVKVELPDGTTELLETIPYENYPTVQSEHAEIDLYGSHTDNVNIHNNKIMSESELFRITHNVNAIPDQSMPGTSTQSYNPDNDQVAGGQDNCQEWDIGMLPFVMETMKEQENTQSLLDKNMQKAKKKKVQEAKLKADICSSNRCCPGCDTFGNHVRKPPKTKKTKTTKIDSALDEEKSRSPKVYRRKFPMERCDFCPMVFRGAWPKYKKQNHIIAEHCSKDVLEELRKRKKKNEVLSEPKSKFVEYSKKPKYEMIRLDLEFPDYLYGMECIECNKVIREEHFRKVLKCTKCNYSTMCSRAYIEHMINMHGTKNRSSNKYVPCSSRFMECACGFVHIEGNKMAEHLLLCEYNQLSCKIVNSKQISSRREDDPDIDVITIEDYINETSQEIESTEISDDAVLQEVSIPSKLLYNYKTQKCSKGFIILKKQIKEEERQRKAIQEVTEHHNYNKPACLSLQTDSKDVYVWESRFSSSIPTVVNESLSTNREISPVIENQALQSVRQCPWSMENCTNSQRRKDLKELIQERQNLEILIRQNIKITLETKETNKKPGRCNIPNNLERLCRPTPTETINKPSRNNVHKDFDSGSWPKPTPKKIIKNLIRSTNHNVLERESRRKMTDLFKELMHSLPKYSAKKERIPKIKILQEAEKCIISLSKELSDLKNEKERLQRQNFLLNENLKHCEDVITVLPLT
ncbi:Hypothetical predicted protein [Mytilus galloprovincialis]|uniref:BHLH domain-containing protein n=1 Tax=Mytilus galloprovincialis TaxID=29158 RepID=A0A8B6E1I0_MYTGA|nr:Hypothetical predicted protein [Mytilus galloprovincialis]